MHSELDAIIEVAGRLLLWISWREFESSTLDDRPTGGVVGGDAVKVVRRLATVAMLRSAVPTRHHLTIVKHLEEVGGSRGMRTVDRVLKPDLRARVDRHIAGSHRIVV